MMFLRKKTPSARLRLLPRSRAVTLCALALSTVFISACGSLNPLKTRLNPFAEKEVVERGKPVNATEYICAGNQHFYVRMLNNNKDAWLIYPDHEVNLNQSATESSVYTSGAIRLHLAGDATTLNDGEKIAYTACKPVAKKTQ